MEHKCNFCEKTFTTKMVLKNHQAKAKFCLKLQNKKPEEIYECLHCLKKFNVKYNFDLHIASHSSDPIFIQLLKYQEESKKLKETLEQKEEEVKIKLENFQKILDDKNEQIKVYQEQNEKLLLKAVSAPKVKNTYNTVNIENFTAMTDEHFQNNAKHLTIEHIKNGAHGYATFIVKYPCKDSIVVADRARKTIKYKDENNELCVDFEARNLLTKISKAIDPINRELLLKAGEELDANKNMDLEYKLSLKSKFLEYCNGIRFMGGPPTEFSRKLAYELMILIPKKISGMIEDKQEEKEDIVSDVESEVIYYSDS